MIIVACFDLGVDDIDWPIGVSLGKLVVVIYPRSTIGTSLLNWTA